MMPHRLEIVSVSIIEVDTDSIVNAANKSLLGGEAIGLHERALKEEQALT